MKNSRQFSSRWFRVYDEAVDDPKLQMLSDKQHRFLFNCWCLASKNGGYLPPISEIAWRFRMSEAKVSSLIAELHERHLLEREADTFTPHNWCSRQFDSDVSTDRVRRFRERQRHVTETPMKRDETVSATVSETAPDTEQNRYRTETDTQSVSRVRQMPRAADLSGQMSIRFEEFWERYPRKQRKDFTCSEWVSVVTVEVERSVFACLERYLASDEVARGVIQNPDKWLYEQHRNEWKGDWPKVRDPPSQAQRRQSAWDEVLGPL